MASADDRAEPVAEKHISKGTEGWGVGRVQRVATDQFGQNGK